MEFETVIGLEVHAELATESKVFCPCKVTFGELPNTYCCPVCMGLPGALPTLNKKVVEYACLLGGVLKCDINLNSTHARKNYFYPDLPKGYQISQGAFPICTNGYLEVDERKIRINRIHIEEDAGKLIHENGKTKVDYNRAGVPLLEIVTEPDLRSSSEAKKFLEKIREILLYLGICNCRMQEGNLRCDVNVSVRRKDENTYNPRCEMKNINSFSAVVRCIEYEEKRQKDIILKEQSIKRETRRWIDEAGESVLMRNKESEADYRYFPEPDLPKIKIEQKDCEILLKSIPEMPWEKRERYIKEFNLSENESDEIVKRKRFTELLDEGVNCCGNPKKIYNLLTGDISRIINEKGTEEIPFGGKELAELTLMIEDGTVSSTLGKEVLEQMFEERKSPKDIVKEKNFTMIEDTEALFEVVKSVISENQKSVEDYKKGKKNVISFLVGRCMRKTDNKAKPELLNKILKEVLDA